MAIDVALHERAEVYRHKDRAASNIHEKIAIAQRQSMKDELSSLETAMRGISLQTYIQAVCMTELVENALRTNMRWFSIASPKNLSSFSGVVDAKDKKRTQVEDLRNTLLMPYLEAHTLNDPLICQ